MLRAALGRGRAPSTGRGPITSALTVGRALGTAVRTAVPAVPWEGCVQLALEAFSSPLRRGSGGHDLLPASPGCSVSTPKAAQPHRPGQDITTAFGIEVFISGSAMPDAVPWYPVRPAAAQHQRPWRAAVPARGPAGLLGVLGAAGGGHLGVQQGLDHAQACGHAHGQQPLPRHGGDISTARRTCSGSSSSTAAVSSRSTRRTGSFFTAVPFCSGLTWRSLECLPHGRIPGGGAPPHFNKPGDNLGLQGEHAAAKAPCRRCLRTARVCRAWSHAWSFPRASGVASDGTAALRPAPRPLALASKSPWRLPRLLAGPSAGLRLAGGLAYLLDRLASGPPRVLDRLPTTRPTWLVASQAARSVQGQVFATGLGFAERAGKPASRRRRSWSTEEASSLVSELERSDRW